MKDELGPAVLCNCQVTLEEFCPVWDTVLVEIYRPKGKCSKAGGGT